LTPPSHEPDGIQSDGSVKEEKAPKIKRNSNLRNEKQQHTNEHDQKITRQPFAENQAWPTPPKPLGALEF
jgi:hypothetical protein